ncbi:MULTISPECIES: hypothetical protein [unclassified Brevundimonas]|uniref:hypothetical protein n=1 Tax=unclassified Brevundimonas TaxID=2622653 RepID=UPI001ADE7E8B|nr:MULTISPECIES: hypothetical protein [unclassified Brevundimonas]
MKSTPILLTAAALLGLGACATASSPESVVSGAPVPVAGLDWRLTQDGGEAKLAFGSEASDDLELAFECTAGARQVAMMAPGSDGDRELHLESGGSTERYRAEAEPLGVRDGVFLTASADAKDPVLQRFRSLGWIARWEGETRETYVAHPATVADVDRFFAACG